MNLLDWLFGPNPPNEPSAWYLLIAFGFALILAGSGLAYTRRRALFPGHSLHIRLASRFGRLGVVLGAIGLLEIALRYLGVSFLSMRLFPLLTGVAVLGLAGYIAWYWRQRYSADVRHQAAQLELPRRPRANRAETRRRQKKRRR